MTVAQPLKFEEPRQGEEDARAALYGLLAALFYAPPTRPLLESIAASEGGGDGILQQAWSGLAAAFRDARAEAVRDEYETLFLGVGKPEVMLYGSFYLSGFMMEKPLAALRTDLAQLGLQRDESVPESEDHIASLCEVMRHLITSDTDMYGSLAAQQRFFASHIQPWADAMCDAIAAHPDARFYRAVAQLAKNFFEVEMQAFDMP